jgi:hypothetical protein
MSLMNLLEFVTAALRSQPSVTLDEAQLQRQMGNNNPLNRVNGNAIAASVINTGAAPFATFELFQRADTGTIFTFMIFARTRANWEAACRALQQAIIASCEGPAEIGIRIETETVHPDPKVNENEIVLGQPRPIFGI